MSASQKHAPGDGSPGDGRDIPLSDQTLLDMLDALMKDRGRVAAAEALGVNYRTMMACHDSRRVSRRMRRALENFQDTGGLADGAAEDANGDDADEDEAETLKQRVAALEEEGRELRELVGTQTSLLAELAGRVAQLEKLGRQQDGSEKASEESQEQVWRPPHRGHGLPDAGVVTIEQQPEEDHAFGPAASLVAEWRALRAGGIRPRSRVDRASAGLRRWELEVAMIRDFHLTLPPETEPLDEARRTDHIRRRSDALAAARGELNRAKWVRLLTLGLWRK